jgi:ribose transport system substrate-binding protein
VRRALRAGSALLAGSLLAGLLFGCEAAPSGRQPGAPAKEPAAAAHAKGKHRTFAVIYATADPMYGKVTEKAEAAAHKLGANLIVKAPDEANVEQQIRMVENLTKQRVDGIAISPVNADALTPYINRAVEAGIPVVCFDMDAARSKRLSYIGIDNYEAGQRMAAYLSDLLKGQGMVVAEAGFSSFDSVQERMNGFRDYLAHVPDLQLLELRTNGDKEEQAIANLEAMIDAHPHFDAFVGFDSAAGAAAVMVWKAKGLYQYALTWNDMPALLEGVKYEQITATLSQREELWGGDIIEALNEAADGKPIAARYKVDPVMITKANLNEWLPKS